MPESYQEFIDFWNDVDRRRQSVEAYANGRQSFVPNLLPEQAVTLSTIDLLEILRRRFGAEVDVALSPSHSDPKGSLADLPPNFRSPAADQPDGSWLKRTNMVGINVRTVGSFWNIIKYALTLPAAQNAIHILPIWEPGVAGSIYGASSWNLNPEFFSRELAEAVPTLSSIDRQLRAVVNLLHLMGKVVGMDVIPHNDRFSQITLAYPEYFEWLQRQDRTIVDHGGDLHLEVQQRINSFLDRNGPAVANEPLPSNLFADGVEEERRMRLLFGLPEDVKGREARRGRIIRHLYRYGYEPVPGTMAPPFRGLMVDTRLKALNVDGSGQIWRDFAITRPESMSRVFGPLARYKLYESRADNEQWELDFQRPRRQVWEYVCQSYQRMQRRYGFDFMRGDMSHVQMRPEGVPAEPDPYYDILGAVKRYIRAKGAPYFGYIAESFLAPRDVMGYGEEMDHLEASEADTTLGDLQSTAVGSEAFLQRFRRYYDLMETRSCSPNFTVMTADKDDPRFDKFYLGGSEVRLFIALFLVTMPSYMGLGFESRDEHDSPAPNEHYSKLYVFQETGGPKATRGPFVWGRNSRLFANILRLRLYADAIWPIIKERPLRWLIPPDATGHNKLIAWTQSDQPQFVFVANSDIYQPAARFGLPLTGHHDSPPELSLDFTTAPETILPIDRTPKFNDKHYAISQMAPGEVRVYKTSCTG